MFVLVELLEVYGKAPYTPVGGKMQYTPDQGTPSVRASG